MSAWIGNVAKNGLKVDRTVYLRLVISLEHQFWSEAIPSNFISNSLTTAQHSTLKITGTFPKLLPAPYPVTGDGLFLVELYETGNITQRIELVIGAFEPV